MEELMRKQFEAQFGSEWSQPVVLRPTEKNAEPEPELEEKVESSASESEKEDEDGPLVVKHTEHQAVITRKNRKQFMGATAPREPVKQQVPTTKEDEDNLKDDLALQRLIEESHILDNQRQHSGADISYGDPMEHIGKTRLAIMQARLEKAGAKKAKQNTPMNIAKGIKAKEADRNAKRKEYANEAGIVLAKEKKIHKKKPQDRGLKINSIGRATAHGVTISEREIARVRRQGKK